MTPNSLYTSPCNPKMFTRYRTVDPLSPDSFEPSLEEIIDALPNINRYNGHTLRPISVAEHCINCMAVGIFNYGLAAPHYKLFLLLHDAAEAYLQDLIRPIKRYMSDEVLLSEAAILKNLISLLPFTDKQRMELESDWFIKIFEEIDTRMAVTEIEQLIPGHENPINGFKSFDIAINNYEYSFIPKFYRAHIDIALKELNEKR